MSKLDFLYSTNTWALTRPGYSISKIAVSERQSLPCQVNTMSQRKTIEQYQLTRMQQRLFDEHTYSFMDPFLPAAANWSSHSVHLYSPSWHKTLHDYLISLDTQAYIIATAFLHDREDPGSRWTDMRLSHMIVDSWLAAGGSASSLRFLGVNWIINQDALMSIAKAFQKADGKSSVHVIDGEQAHVITVKPVEMVDNPFVRCAMRVEEILSSIAGRSVVVKTVSLVRSESFVTHMVVEFEPKQC